MAENQTFRPSLLGIIPTAIGLVIFCLYFGRSLIITKPLFGLAFVPIIMIVLFFVYLSIKMTSYELRLDGMFIKRGIITKKQILLLYKQIQDVTEYQTLWGRIVGLKELRIETMTSASSFAGKLPNLRALDADALKELLMQEIHGQSVKGKKVVAKTEIKYDSKSEQDQENPYPVHFEALGVTSTIIILTALIVLFSLVNLAKFSIDFGLIVFIIMVLFIPVSFFIQQATFKYWTGANTITIKSGWLNTRKTIMEYDKIQDFISSRGLIARIFGWASIRLETGSMIVPQGSNDQQRPNYTISTLKAPHARALADLVMKKMGIAYTPQSNPLVQQIPLSTNKVIKKTVSGMIWIFVLVVLFLIGILLLGTKSTNGFEARFMKILLWTAISFTAIVILTVIYQKMYYDRYYYDWSKNTLTIRKGVIWIEQIFLPFEKIQNVFMDQDLFDRLFGLYDVHVSTVGKGSIRLCHIDGLVKDNANKMVTVLLKQVKENN